VARLRWAAIAVFVLVPWAITYALLGLRTDFYSNLYRKVPLLAAQPQTDTLIAGDSRVLRVSGDPMRARGWVPFNFGLSAASSEDIAMQVRYTTMHAPIRRVIIGLNPAGMSDVAPFESSVYVDEAPFSSPEIRGFAELEPGAADRRPRPAPPSGPAAYILPVSRATKTLHGLLDHFSVIHAWDGFYADGTVAYTGVRDRIASGRFEFERERDPTYWMSIPGGDFGYRRSGQLAPHAKAVYLKVLSMLQSERIPVVLFETGRGPRYRAAVAADPMLTHLLGEWRAFFKSTVGPCVAFLDGDDLSGVYRDEDFFDAAHIIGPSELRLGERLTAEMARLEARCRAQ
jgi:hypothetical protein